jgi:hypothetical protein
MLDDSIKSLVKKNILLLDITPLEVSWLPGAKLETAFLLVLALSTVRASKG